MVYRLKFVFLRYTMSKEKEEREPLTDTQAECYNALVFYIKEHGMPPTVREIANILGKTGAAVMPLIYKLEEKGWVKRTEGVSRGTLPVGYKYGIDSIKNASPDKPYSFK